MIIDTYGQATANRIDEERIKPNYNGFNLYNVPNSILEVFGIGNQARIDDRIFTYFKGSYDKVVFFYLDGFGYDKFMDPSYGSKLRDAFVDNGYVCPITTVFPSTTAAANTTINTGLPPSDHGLLEWILYFDEARTVALTLPYRPIIRRYRKRFESMNPANLFRGETIFHRLRSEGIRSVSFLKSNIVNGEYTKLVQNGSDIVGYSYITDGLILLRDAILKGAYDYYYFYVDNIDHIGHVYGPESEMYRTEASTISDMIANMFRQIPKDKLRNTLVVITSDHGHIQVDPSKTIFLNDKRKIFSSLKSDGRYKIPPVGSPRDVFLFIKKDHLDDVLKYAKKHFQGALVDLVENIVSQQFFGPHMTGDLALRRAGNLLIVPPRNDMIWYKLPGLRDSHMKGMHGGLSESEMLIPLVFGEASEIF
ncbi:alkaline phosphatase family protein [Thermoplasma sp.]|uniref:alkaline phosphatase family protein n=1 Tax=Thermoplasma sp. TaxID=1973142 RepID=UPI00262B91DC|nr:alkaline phosphatase family protein [Thermoplasma sp.]